MINRQFIANKQARGRTTPRQAEGGAMIRWPGAAPMTPTEFEDALAEARRGEITTDNGAGQRLEDALIVIIMAGEPTPPELIEEARSAYAEQSTAI